MNAKIPLRRGPGTLYRSAKSLEFLATRDRAEVVRFLSARYPRRFSLSERLTHLSALVRTTNAVRGYHTLAELLRITDRVLRRPGATVVECGAGSGASTAKLSLAVRRVSGRLHVFDSFRGIPPNDEIHENIYGQPVIFRAGAFTGRIRAVKRVVARYGAPEVCTFHKGLFRETLVGFSVPLDVVVLDVDLLSSTRDCLEVLYPQLVSGGVLFTQDGHLRAIAERLGSAAFWRQEIGVAMPQIKGLGTDKLLEIPR